MLSKEIARQRIEDQRKEIEKRRIFMASNEIKEVQKSISHAYVNKERSGQIVE